MRRKLFREHKAANRETKQNKKRTEIFFFSNRTENYYNNFKHNNNNEISKLEVETKTLKK